MFSSPTQVKSPSHPENAIIELIQGDLRQLSQETRKRFGPIKEAAEAAILKIKTLCSLNDKKSSGGERPLNPLKQHCNVVLQPFLMGCDTKCANITLLCITSIQRLITHQVR